MSTMEKEGSYWDFDSLAELKESDLNEVLDIKRDQLAKRMRKKWEKIANILYIQKRIKEMDSDDSNN